MIRDNVLKAIEIMRRAKNHNSFNMTSWQNTKSGTSYNENELHSCGNTACFAGYIGLSPEFKADGGRINSIGAPIMPNDSDLILGSEAIAEWLGISEDLSVALIYGSSLRHRDFYHKDWSDVTPDDVIKQLNRILSGDLS